MSHNKERRSKRDEKLDKKSQAMEELKAEREKKKNKTGWCHFVCKHGAYALKGHFQFNIFQKDGKKTKSGKLFIFLTLLLFTFLKDKSRLRCPL